MKALIEKISKLKKSELRNVIDKRMSEFEKAGKYEGKEFFDELCYCLLTANFSAEGAMKIQKNIGNGFHTLSEDKLAGELKRLGHRFPNMRAKFIVESRQHKKDLNRKLSNMKNDDERRDWLVKNIKGLGMKEASHFLRNVGYKDLSIIDFHIIDLLVSEGLIESPKSKSLTPKKYREIEDIIKQLSSKTGLNLGELDLYLWSEETGKVLK